MPKFQVEKMRLLGSGGTGQAELSHSESSDLAPTPHLGDFFSHTFSKVAQVTSRRKIKRLQLFTNLR